MSVDIGVKIASVKIVIYGYKLREARLNKGLKQRELAEAVGVTTSHICDMEHERNNCSEEVYDRLIRVLS